MPNNNSPQVLIGPLKPALILGLPQNLPVLLRVQTPDAPPSEKPVRKGDRPHAGRGPAALCRIPVGHRGA